MIFERAKRTFALALSLLVFLAALPFAAAEKQERGGDVLLVCESLFELEELSALISACGKSAQAILEKDYPPGMAAQCGLLITTCKAALEDAGDAGVRALFIGGGLKDDWPVHMEELKNVSVQISGGGYGSPSRFEESLSVIDGHYGGELAKCYGEIAVQGKVYPFAINIEDVTYAPHYRAGDLSFFLLGAVMQEFFGNEAPGKMYVLIDDVYAFTDLYALCAAADMLYESAIPFIVRVRPMYDNLDFPAFKRYAQVLRYMQAKNGVIVPGEPFISENEQVREPLEVKMGKFFSALDDEGIAYIEMEHSPLVVDMETLWGIRPPERNFGRLSIDAMINFTIIPDEKLMREELNNINDLWLTIDDYRRNFTNAVYQYHEVAIGDQYEYFKEEEKLFAEQFAKGNEVLLVVVGIALMVLLALLLVGGRVNRRKFRKG